MRKSTQTKLGEGWEGEIDCFVAETEIVSVGHHVSKLSTEQLTQGASPNSTSQTQITIIADSPKKRD